MQHAYATHIVPQASQTSQIEPAASTRNDKAMTWSFSKANSGELKQSDVMLMNCRAQGSFPSARWTTRQQRAGTRSRCVVRTTPTSWSRRNDGACRRVGDQRPPPLDDHTHDTTPHLPVPYKPPDKSLQQTYEDAHAERERERNGPASLECARSSVKANALGAPGHHDDHETRPNDLQKVSERKLKAYALCGTQDERIAPDGKADA